MTEQATPAGMLRLTETSDARAPCLLPPGRDPTTWHAAVTREIAAGLTLAHAALLATPQRQDDGVAWFAHGAELRRLADFAGPERARLTTATAGAMLSDIRRLAESQRAPAVTDAWPALREIPDLACLFVLDGRPVLAGWGHGRGGGGPLARFDDGVAWRAEPRNPWQVYGVSAVSVACLALSAGLLLPTTGWPLVRSPLICRIAPSDLELLADAQRAAARAAELRRDLAAVTQEQGRRALDCAVPAEAAPPPPPPPGPAKLPVPPPPAPAPPAPVPAPTPPAQHGDRLVLPNGPTRDLSFLQGCWRTDRYRHPTDNEDGVSRYCFDAQGRGSFEYRSGGVICRSGAQARYDGNILRLDDADSRCSDGSDWSADHLVCHAGPDGVADCGGEASPGGRQQRWHVNLHRAEARQ